MSDAIQSKNKEAESAWSEYLAASLAAERNRSLVREIREKIYAQIGQGEAVSQEYIVLRSAQDVQTRLNDEEERLGKRFDAVSDELALLQRNA